MGQCETTNHETMENMKIEFKNLLEGFTIDSNARVMVLVAANHSLEFDETIWMMTWTAEENKHGIPLKTQELYALVLLTRYLDLFAASSLSITL